MEETVSSSFALYSECLYEGKADMVYLQVSSVWSTFERLVVEILTIGAIQVRFLSFLSFFPLDSQRRSVCPANHNMNG